jgi:hypothetical protein
MRYRGENLVENSVNKAYREGYRERGLEIAQWSGKERRRTAAGGQLRLH